MPNRRRVAPGARADLLRQARGRARRSPRCSINLRFALPALAFLVEAEARIVQRISGDALEQNARLLEGVLEDFGVKGEIINVRPGPGRDALRTGARAGH